MNLLSTPRRVHLARVHAWVRVGLQPRDNSQEAFPSLRQMQGLDRAPGHPHQQRGLRSRCLLPQRLEALGLACLADEGQGRLNGVDSDGCWKPLRSLNSMVPVPPVEPYMRGVGDGANPVTDCLEAI